MKPLFFLLTYAIGLFALVVPIDQVLLYFLVFGLYIACFYNSEKESFRFTVLHPTILSTISSFAIYAVHGIDVTTQAVFLSPLLFAYVMYNLRKEAATSSRLIVMEYFLLPIATPIALCFLLSLFFVNPEIAAVLFLFMYYGLLMYLLQGVPSVQYTILACLTQNAVLAYLLNYIHFFTTNEKMLLMGCMTILFCVNGFCSFRMKKRGDLDFSVNKERKSV